MKTLTQVQEAAIAYALRSRNTYRTQVTALKRVHDFCEKNGFSPEQARQCACDMWDMVKLGRGAK